MTATERPSRRIVSAFVFLICFMLFMGIRKGEWLPFSMSPLFVTMAAIIASVTTFVWLGRRSKTEGRVATSTPQPPNRSKRNWLLIFVLIVVFVGFVIPWIGNIVASSPYLIAKLGLTPPYPEPDLGKTPVTNVQDAAHQEGFGFIPPPDGSWARVIVPVGWETGWSEKTTSNDGYLDIWCNGQRAPHPIRPGTYRYFNDTNDPNGGNDFQNCRLRGEQTKADFLIRGKKDTLYLKRTKEKRPKDIPSSFVPPPFITR